MIEPLQSEFTEPPRRKRWTREECHSLLDAGVVDIERYELIEGELIGMTKHYRHDSVLRRLVLRLGRVFGHEFVMQETAIDVSPEDNPTNEPQPDAVVLTFSVEGQREGIVPADIRLLVEVADSTLGFALRRKAGLYARALIPEYWVLDVQSRRMIVHREPADGKYTSVLAYAENEPVSPLAAPDELIRIDKLL